MEELFQHFPDKRSMLKNSNIRINNFRKLFALLLLASSLGSCIDRFNPPAIEQNESFLVVDGFLNTGTNSSTITLSRTQNLAESGKSKLELKAKVSIEEEIGKSYALEEAGNGVYTISNLTLNNAGKYRLSIRTSSGSQYYSDYVTTQITPAIDSISWKIENNGLQIYNSTHDPLNNTWYYRWEYEETWEIASVLYSPFLYKDGKVVDRPNENITNCWKNNKSNTIIIGTSFRQSQDVIQNHPLTFIQAESQKTYIKYSILVRQYALSKDAYEYWQKLKRNTEGMGTLFDPQPSDVTGNIHSVSNPKALVFGYFSATSAVTKRIFIKANELPRWRHITGYEFCEMDTIEAKDWPDKYSPTMAILYEIVGGPGGYAVTAMPCVDCRLLGSNVKPDFWK